MHHGVDSLILGFSDFNVHTAFESPGECSDAGLRRGLRLCISNQLPGHSDAAGRVDTEGRA